MRAPEHAHSLSLALEPDRSASEREWATRMVRDLAKLQSLEGYANPWSEATLDDLGPYGAAERRARLRAHLSITPRVLLVGEAPGYRGARVSGVPFTSEALLLSGAVPRCAADSARLSNRERPWSEPSATIVWRTLYKLNLAAHTWLWNACALHPHLPDLPLSNRAPGRDGLELSQPLLRRIVKRCHGHGATVIAVGAVAERCLASVGAKDCVRVRHPAYGGARHFADALAGLCK